MITPKPLAPGEFLLDWSFDKIDPAAALRAGARGAFRYSAGAASDPKHPSYPSVAKKLITPREFARFIAVGAHILASDEWYATRPTEGPAAAVDDANAACTLWHNCGLARGASISVAIDFALSAEHFPQVDAYLDAYAKVAAGYGYQLVQAYAGTPYLRHRLGTITPPVNGYGHRPSAGSWSDDGLPYQPNTKTRRRRARLVRRALEVTPARVWQDGNTWAHGGADEDLILRVPVGSHQEALAGNPKPPPPPPPPPHHLRPARFLVSPDHHYRLGIDDSGAIFTEKDGKRL